MHYEFILHSAIGLYSCQDYPTFDWNGEYSQLVTSRPNSRKSNNECCRPTCRFI